MNDRVTFPTTAQPALVDVKGSGDVLGVFQAILSQADEILGRVKAEPGNQASSHECACKHKLDKPAIVPNDVQMAELREKSAEERKRSKFDSIANAKEETKDLHEKRREERAEAAEKHKEAQKAGVWGKVFGWLGTIATAIMAIGCLLTPGLQGAAVALFAATALSAMSLTEGGMKALTSVMESIAKVILELPGVKELLDKFGVKEEDFIKVCAQVLVVALIVGSSIAAACVTGGASLAGTVAQFAAKAASMAQKIISAVMTHLPRIVKSIEFAVGVGTAATGIAKGAIQYETTQVESAIKKLQGLLKDLQRIIEDNTESLKSLFQEIADIWQGCSDLIQSSKSSTDVVNRNMV
ncbi:type III secretion system translocon subunit SctE [Spartinivicinus poritis]|uniref:Type III secretion system translocon subunit SctE n=1 Tax=Spartinivicinus poritis TaxID=2994640 RepID=A0ABT5U6B6_9GAMM|nr:type III secretion system translocon subunit SctE [Spartinivicinus sp. A2-2]MDE1461008.1 type III secretion system translocon subunit SctE [Spartinivicinus sp. A2-2]